MKSTKRIILAALMTLGTSIFCAAADNPAADPAAMVTIGNARFTVLTGRLIRMEWSEDGRFEDEATLAIVNRRLPVPDFKVTKSAGKLTLRTDALTLTYKNTGKFSEDNLSVSFSMSVPGAKKPVKVTWTPGTDDSGNLLGTARTLDRCATKEDIFQKQGMDKGVISRDGWAIIDESTRHIFKAQEDEWGHWVECRPEGDRQDLYIFAYGHDYTTAITDYTRIAGRVPLPPKYAFGFWQSRYWSYSDYEFIDMAKRFRREDIPADVMIIDMDWHRTYEFWDGKRIEDEFGQRRGWTGYTWNENLFPDPEATLTELHDLGFKTALNLHPASGIIPMEEPYERFIKDYTSRTSDYDGPKGYVYGKDGYKYAGNKEAVGTAGEKAPAPFRISQKEFAESYFKTVIHPLERQGVDFWWLDWQQWKTSKYVRDLSMTFWLNFTFFQDKVRQSASEGRYADRAMIYHRWGGLGSHRYQLGFSGDTYVEWSALAMEPWFTATSANVCYGYWGHDLGGHMGDNNGMDAELFTRWLQYGVFSPIFKVHSSKNPDIERRFWNFPGAAQNMKDAVRLRYTLSRYIYDAARECYDTGISICRPLYYYAPEQEKSYTAEQEFFFGGNILATAICRSADPATGLSERYMWFPEGSDWYDMSTGRIYKGGTEQTLWYAINENPWFVRTGSILPLASKSITNLQEPDNELGIFVAPGEGSAEYTTYEDDGTTQAFETEFATTRISKTSDASSVRVTVDPRKGSYRGMNPKRRINVVMEAVFAPTSVRVNGVDVPYSRFPGKETDKAVWSYDGASLAVTVYLPEAPADRTEVVECCFDPSEDRSVIEGKKGLMGRITSVTDEVKRLWSNPAVEYLRIANCPSLITAEPSRACEILSGIDVEAMDKCWSRKKNLSQEFVSRMKALAR